MSAGNMKVLFEERRTLVGAKYARHVFAHVRALLGRDMHNKRYLVVERYVEDSESDADDSVVSMWAGVIARSSLLLHPATDSTAIRCAVAEANMYYLACTKLLESFPKDEFTAPITFTRYTVDEYGILHGKNEVVREGEPEEPAT